jgi:ArsR family transcriptional regulator, virulence genes transcriptional regulator
MTSNDLKKLKGATRLLKHLAHPVRLALLCHLNQGNELSAGVLAKRVKHNAGQPQVSQYLAQMRRMKLVKTRRDGQTIHYRLTSKEAKALIKTLYGLYCGRA